jgi:MSHA biogenesis protein MshO
VVPQQSGFTLVELVLVIVILGVIAAIASVFIRYPVDGYLAAARRATVADTADTTVRRIARDFQRALPNSVRTSTTGTACVEFVLSKVAGRYRTEDATTGDGTALDFSTQDSKFNMLWSNSTLPSQQQVKEDDLVVVYNLGVSGASIYNADNYSKVTSVAASGTNETTINIEPKQFPLESGSSRFHVVASDEQQVAYVCSGFKLYRTVGALTSSAACLATGDVIASQVDCTNTSFTFDGSDLQRNGLITIRLALQDSDHKESITLHHEVHVSNTP